jgi:hypothetical protein
MPRELRIHGPDGQIKNVPLVGDRVSVGRSGAADISYPEDAGLSRQHFVFEPEGEDWAVRDLGPNHRRAHYRGFRAGVETYRPGGGHL